jgi:predicted nucleotidyltransferase
VEAALAHVPLAAAILAGSAGRGDADFFSDLDVLLYVDELPQERTLDAIRVAVGGTDPLPKESTEHACGVEFQLDGVRTEVVFFTVARVEWLLEQLRERADEIDPTQQKVLLGMLEGLVLHGEELVEDWQQRIAEYPEPLRRLLIERHWRFFPLWYHADEIAARDAEFWRIDILLDAVFDLLAVLAALNRLYFARMELKRMRALTERMELAPADLAERLTSLFQLGPDQAAAELGALVEETRALVASEFPDLELPLRFPPGTRKRPWAPRPPN